MKASHLAWPYPHIVGSLALIGVLTLMVVAGPSVVAQGTVLFDTRAVDARVWHPERCEPVTGEDFVAQLYVEQGPVGVPVPFGADSEAGYVLGGEVVVPSAGPWSQVMVEMRFWEPEFDSYGEAEAAGGWHGRTGSLLVSLGEPGLPGPLLGMETVWGACPSEIALRIELGEGEASLIWEIRGFPSGYIVVPQEAEQPTGPWSDMEGWWNPVNGRANPPNPLSLQEVDGVRFYRMRLTTNIGA
jgi:hypothetical protein